MTTFFSLLEIYFLKCLDCIKQILFCSGKKLFRWIILNKRAWSLRIFDFRCLKLYLVHDVRVVYEDHRRQRTKLQEEHQLQLLQEQTLVK